MNDENVQLRISIISVPDDVSPLKLRGFLQKEAADIQAKAARNSFVVVRLFMPQRTLFAVTQKKLDTLLDDMVNKHASIHRVELRVVERGLGMEQMQDAAMEAQADLGTMVEELQRLDESRMPGAE